MVKQITGGLKLSREDAAVFHTAYQLKDVLGEPRPPYHYHTTHIVRDGTNVLQTILNNRKLRNPNEGRSIMFTADKIGPAGTITSSGLNDPAYSTLAERALREGRATLVFDTTITNSSS